MLTTGLVLAALDTNLADESGEFPPRDQVPPHSSSRAPDTGRKLLHNMSSGGFKPHRRMSAREIGSQAVCMGKPGGLATPLPFAKRHTKQQLSQVLQVEINLWFQESDITVGPGARGREFRARVRQLLFTWRDVFICKLSEFSRTDIVEHEIILNLDELVCFRLSVAVLSCRSWLGMLSRARLSADLSAQVVLVRARLD